MSQCLKCLIVLVAGLFKALSPLQKQYSFQPFFCPLYIINQIINALLLVIARVLNLRCLSESSKDLVKKEDFQNPPLKDSYIVGFEL